ncbi:MAG: Fe-S cluster assembly protein SufD [Bacteroidales bacterium]|jgi:Fe-S cluster assembly protein SufD|nr:Fe-S cluster assembly protein SufD [Bacteroidales bacterium]
MDQGDEPVIGMAMDYLENNIVVESGQQRQIVVLDDTEHLQANEEHCDIVVKENGFLELYRIQNLDDTTPLKTHIHIRQERDSRVHFVVISFNAGDLCNHIEVDIDGEGSDTQVYGLYLVDKKQHVENFLKINHNVPHCTSDTRFKGIMDDEASAVFNGHVYVAPGAQKTDAQQNNANIILTPTARIDTKPFLEIYADDVKCSHGTSTGQLDQEAMFYMRQRGISKANARMLLMYAFAAEISNHIQIDDIKDTIDDMIKRRLRGELSSCDHCVLHCKNPRM